MSDKSIELKLVSIALDYTNTGIQLRLVARISLT